MQPGKILVANQAGIYLIKLVGDVRLTLSGSLDHFLSSMLEDRHFRGVFVDLCQAEGVDSTTLGLLAKLALRAQQHHGIRPTLISTRDDINRLLDCMGFDSIYHIVSEPLPVQAAAGELPVETVDEEQARETVLEAHRILMGLNARNQEEFKELVASLEADQ